MAFARCLVIAFAGLALAACSSPSEDTDGDNETPDTIIAEGPSMDEIFNANLPWNADADGVVTTESGLSYLVLSKGDAGGASPTERDTVTVMYEGRLARNGEQFDSSYERGSPATFPLGGVIAGWTEGLQYMSIGDDVLFHIPANLAYGDNPRPGVIQPGDDLVFRVELLEIMAAPEPRPTDDEAWATYTPWDAGREGIITTESGLQYVILESVEEGPSPELTDFVVVYYEGRLDETGEVFDSAFQRGEPAQFPAGRLIPGWVEALGLMKTGERWLIHVPSDLGYGVQGTPGGPIPPNADLNFEVELVDVLPVQ
ncbi:MAG: FKBP-type peptidyl-prolyl cis-trans isomerase [Pseudomonadota bacterium]